MSIHLRTECFSQLQSTKSQKSNSHQNITTGVTSIPPTTSVSSSVQAGYSSNMKHAPPNLPRIPSQISIHPQPPQVDLTGGLRYRNACVSPFYRFVVFYFPVKG